MIHRILSKIQSEILDHPRSVLWASVALVVVALILGSGVEFRTSRSELAPPGDPDQRRMEDLIKEFGGSSDLIACAEAAPGVSGKPADLRRFADALAAVFKSDPLVERVFHRVHLEWFVEHGLYLVPPGAIREAAGAIREERSALARLASARDVADLNDAIAERLESGLAEPGPAPPEDEAKQGIAHLSSFLRLERRFFEDTASVLEGLESRPPLLTMAGDREDLRSQGYLGTQDGMTLFIMISPVSADDSLPVLRRFVGAMRERAREVLAAHPGFRVAFTGEPATTVEEMEVVRRDTWFTAAVSAVGVAALTLLVFRWRSHAWLVLLALGAGVAWSFGAVRLEMGYLNLITSSFISTLVGVGVAYGIHPVSEYELEGAHTVDPARAIRGAYHATGAAITVGAVTTAAAFFSILLMEFRGFAELGLVAGVGVLLCLVASLITLPAILLVYGRWRHARDTSARAGPATAAVDRLWVERGAVWVCRWPRTTTALAAVLTIAMGWVATGIRFDTNIFDLLPRGAESVRYQNRMIMDSDLSPIFNMAVADDIEALRGIRARAAAEPTIDRFDSALQFLPEDVEASRAAARDLGALLPEIHLPEETRAAGRGRIAGSLRRLEEALARSSESAFGAGLGALAAPLEEARAEAEAVRLLVEKAPPGSERAWSDGQQRVLAWARGALEDLRRAARAEPPNAENLPEEIRGRFMTSKGRFVAFLHPKGNVFVPAFLERFVAASRRVDPDVTGFPILFHRMSRRIVDGFAWAAGAAAILVFLILLADYRNLREPALALLPLVVGMVWMLGAMRLLGYSFNFANLVTVPLIIGVGIDNGVHVVHRLRLEGADGMTVVLRHTGRAILIAGLTTMIGFGSLALASHRGLASLGAVLLFGVGACVLTATVVLPNFLVATGRYKG